MTVVWIVVGAILGLLCLAAIFGVWVTWRRADDRALIKRIARLSLRNKLRLAFRLARDPRIPLLIRLIPPALILYLAMPIDVIPDFIPLVGYLDDLLIVAVAAGVLLRFAPRDVVEEHVARLTGVPASSTEMEQDETARRPTA